MRPLRRLAALLWVVTPACGGGAGEAVETPADAAGTPADAVGTPADAVGTPADAATPIADADPFAEGALRLDQIRARGTHNSYHLHPDNTVPDWAYDHLPLDRQAGELGVRQFELDVHFRPDGAYHVYHLPAVDDRSTCDRFTDCLTVLHDWSVAHPRHVPLVVLLEPKDDVDVVKVRDHLPELEAEILSIWPRGSVLAPRDVQGTYPDLRTAVTTRGWPALDAVRGRILFVLLDETLTRSAYLALHPGSTDGLLFAPGPPDEPTSAFLLLDDAVGDEAAIAAAVQAGQLVRTMADDDAGRAAALRAGAHFISSDHPEALVFDGATGPPSGTGPACNPARPTPACVPGDVEDAALSPP